MLIPIIIFAISGFGILLLVSVKVYQQATDVQLPLLLTRNTWESKVKKVEHIISVRMAAIKSALHPHSLEKGLVAAHSNSNKAFTYIKNGATVPGHWLDRRTRKLVSLVRGKQDLPNRGTPSSYIRDISRH